MNEGIPTSAEIKRSIGAYNSQKGAAKRRHIAFLLSFDEWLRAWKDSGFYDKRGSKHGGYVMARFGDVGPYAWDNIYICTTAQNLIDNRYNRRVFNKKFPRTKRPLPFSPFYIPSRGVFSEDYPPIAGGEPWSGDKDCCDRFTIGLGVLQYAILCSDDVSILKNEYGTRHFKFCPYCGKESYANKTLRTS